MTALHQTQSEGLREIANLSTALSKYNYRHGGMQASFLLCSTQNQHRFCHMDEHLPAWKLRKTAQKMGNRTGSIIERQPIYLQIWYKQTSYPTPTNSILFFFSSKHMTHYNDRVLYKLILDWLQPKLNGMRQAFLRLVIAHTWPHS